MTIYNNEQIDEKIEYLTGDQAKTALRRLLRRKISQAAKDELVAVIMGIYDFDKEKAVCTAAPGRVIKYEVLLDIKNSGLLQYLDSFIEAAASATGPYQTRDIMLMAAVGRDNCFYLTPKGISQRHKVWAGHLLAFAQFAWRSHYDKDTGKNTKVWKKVHGTGHMTNEDRAYQARAFIESELRAYENYFATAAKPRTTSTFDDLV